MANAGYSALVASQREFFLSGATRPAAWRKVQLEAVKALWYCQLVGRRAAERAVREDS